MMKGNKYCIYLRKSRADQEAELRGEGETLARHEQTLLALAKKLNIQISAIYKEIVSGETISARPEMIRLLNEVEAGLWDGVLVMEIERLARGATIDQGIVAQAFQLSGTKIITPIKTYDPNDEFDEEYFEFGLFMARREYKTINRRIQRGRVKSASEGKYLGSTAPYGYKRVKLKNDKGWTLEIVPEQAEVVRMIFDLYVNGELNPDGTRTRIGSHRICTILDNIGAHTATGKSWSPSSIRDILKNPVYIGKIRWGYDKDIKTSQNGIIKTTRKRNSECNLVDGLHPAIIDVDIFEKAQKLLKNNRKNTVSSRQLRNPLTGLVYCKKCGQLMTRLGANSKTPYDTLKCPNRYCDNVSAPLYLVEQKLIDSLNVWIKDYELNIDSNIFSNFTFEYNESYSALEKELAELKLQLDNTFDLLERGVYDDDTFLKRNQYIKSKIKDCESSISKIEDLKAEQEKIEEYKNNFLPTVKTIVDGYYNIEDATAKNELLKTVIDHIEYVKFEKNTRGKRENDNFELFMYPAIPYK